jgi:hypothetical protein
VLLPCASTTGSHMRTLTLPRCAASPGEHQPRSVVPNGLGHEHKDQKVAASKKARGSAVVSR